MLVCAVMIVGSGVGVMVAANSMMMVGSGVGMMIFSQLIVEVMVATHVVFGMMVAAVMMMIICAVMRIFSSMRIAV